MFTTELLPAKAKDFRKFLEVYGYDYTAREFYGKVRFSISCSHYGQTEILEYLEV